MKRGIMILVAVSSLLAGCGGDGTGEAASPDTTAQEATPGAEPPAPETSATKPEASEEPVASGQEGTGTATIGDTTWDVALSGTPGEICDLDLSDAGLAFAVVMFGTDDTGRQITVNISGPLSGDGDILVQAGSSTLEFERWTADPTVYDRLSGIQGMPEGVGATVSVDGNTVSGSGVFYDDTTLTEVRSTGDAYDAGVLEGTFTATCPTG